MNVAIMDAGGELIYFQSIDNAFSKNIEISMLKASTSERLHFSTRRVKKIAVTRVPGLAHAPEIATFEGGLPVITAGGAHVGAIGVSGAAASNDGLCAQAGIYAIASDLQ